ncbi:nicotinamide-nucleotide amidohydrolase family protein [Halobacteriovorax sp.]|uniref:nicotinamide-nucleotide amidohydrolase family protein n=1 Tax=Halobacteriovorax sp. TaxID=2020862 RepID=UPI00356A310B
MNCALLIIGDELLAGRTRDLNGHWLSKYLPSVGLKLKQIKIINDHEAEIKASIVELYETVDIIITSGGLGPTKDDITKNILAKHFQKDLIFDDKSIELIKSLYAKFDKEWTPSKNAYHYYPRDFELLNNLNGYAPGLLYTSKGKTILSAPGVPREFKSMVENTFVPKLKEIYSDDSFQVTDLFSIRTRGVPEEIIFGELCPTLWEDLSEIAKVSSLPNLLGIDIVLYFNQADKDITISKAKAIIESSALKEHVWQYGNLELEELIVKEATEKKLTIGFAESCTGGLTSSKITDISGSSQIFYGSIVSYANSVKTNLLKVNANTLENFGAVSVECAKEMALGARNALECDIAISYTGIAGPGGATPTKPVGTVGIGWATKSENSSTLLYHKGDRLGLKERFSRSGLFKLLELIRDH